MTLQFSVKQSPIKFIEAPSLITISVIVWLLIEDLFKISKPYLITAGHEIRLTIENDETLSDGKMAMALLPVAISFAVCYVMFLVKIWS